LNRRADYGRKTEISTRVAGLEPGEGVIRKPIAAKTAVIFDRYPLVVRAIEAHVRRTGLEIVGRSSTPERALAVLAEQEPDLFIAGLSTPPGSIDGVELLRAALDLHSGMKVIAFADTPSDRRVEEVFAAGASAFLGRSARRDDMAFAIRQTYEPSIHLAAVRSEPEQSPEAPILTERESEVLSLVAEGYSNRELSKMLGIAHQTVKYHLSNLFQKLEVDNRTQAARQAQLLNLLPEVPRRVPVRTGRTQRPLAPHSRASS
jgi:two-component system, NarL family, response regulator LiaR